MRLTTNDENTRHSGRRAFKQPVQSLRVMDVNHKFSLADYNWWYMH